MAIKLYKCLGSFRMPEAIILVLTPSPWVAAPRKAEKDVLTPSEREEGGHMPQDILHGGGERTKPERVCMFWCHGGGNRGHGHGRGQAVLPALWLIMTRPPPTPKKITRKLRPQQQPADSSRLLLKLVHERNHTMRRFH